jgi:hypothetical protein
VWSRALLRAHPAIAATITNMHKFSSRRNPARDFTTPNAIIIIILSLLCRNYQDSIPEHDGELDGYENMYYW